MLWRRFQFLMGLLLVGLVEVKKSTEDPTVIFTSAMELEKQGKWKEALLQYDTLFPLQETEQENVRKSGISRTAINLATTQPNQRKKLRLFLKSFLNDPSTYLLWLEAWESASDVPSEQAIELPHFSVLVPCYNCAKTVTESLASLMVSLQYLHKKCATVPALLQKAVPKAQIILVNDGSSDSSVTTIQTFIDENDFPGVEYSIHTHERNKGHGAARNTALKAVNGDVVFFLDADDLYFEEHLYISLIFLAVTRLPWSQTAMYPSDPIHETWIAPLSNTLLLTKALTRRVINFLEEFPDLGRAGGEDAIFYLGLVQQFPHKAYIPKYTVQYCRYPGNGFDVQYAKFQQPFQASLNQAKPEASEEEKQIGQLHNNAHRKYNAKWARKALMEQEKDHRNKRKRNEKEEL